VQLPANTESYNSFHDDSVDDPGQAEAHHHITQHLLWRQSTRAQQRPLTSWSFARLQLAHQCGHSTETALLHIMNSVCVVRDHYPWHCTSAPADCHYLVAGNRLQVAFKLQSFTVARPVVVSLRSLGLWFTCRKDTARACYYYKMASLTFKVLTSSMPAYLSDLIQPDALLLSVPRTQTELARLAFSIMVPHT